MKGIQKLIYFLSIRKVLFIAGKHLCVHSLKKFFLEIIFSYLFIAPPKNHKCN